MCASSLFDLTDRVALVTGGGTGIGYMIAQGLAANGAKVYISGRRGDVLANAAREFEGKGELIPLLMDVTSKASILAAKDIIAAADGRLDILVNNAGQSGPRSMWMSDASAPQNGDAEAFGMGLLAEEQGPFPSGTPEKKGNWADLFAINTLAPFSVTTAFLGLLAKGSERHGAYSASVINVTSMSGTLKLAQNFFAYGASKAATAHLTKILATELARRSIPVRVNALAPGVFESEMTRANLYLKVTDGQAQKIGLQPVPAGRIGDPNEMAGTAVWMASAAGGYLNGQEVLIDGGCTTTNPARG
ncbi:NAD(P)-binding protein [Schizophyllum commune H4-8]|uniref:Uncharacterized protein n=1 Tax=Schizophyllum commune (strain H4-8 / FGSC 9210) TaxID=578458 RepID=D8QF97_SCHCM|nr:NAD(P)-binding protein [Schizophyllum commune H4-8]KAI5887550.1 NAD(P)-binding protein [Schizophyllum commune H4-8]